MRGIFISYRREDSEGQAGRLFDDLAAQFGREQVFMDVATIKKGMDFRRSIEEQVATCGVLLVVIGKHWLDAVEAGGQRRLDNTNDFVRLETAAALVRDIPVIPVLVQDASMPREQDLPEPLRALAYRNSAELTHARWTSDVASLIDDLKPYMDSGGSPAPTPAVPLPTPPAGADPAHSTRPRGKRTWQVPALVVAGVLVAVAAYRFYPRPDPWREPIAVASADPAQMRPATAVEGPGLKPTPAVQPTQRGDTCLNGYVWREATANDRVCVTPETRKQTAEDNASAASRREPGGGAYGPQTCRQGFIWRDSIPGDTVCVTPAVHDAARRDNAEAADRVQPKKARM